MRVDEARDERLAAQVDDPRLGTLELHHLVARPDGNDSATRYGNGLGLRLTIIDSDDVSACIDGIGAWRHWGGKRKRLPQACGDGHNDDR
jgi:hypothetical protein